MVPTFGTQADELSAEYIQCPAASNIVTTLAESGDTFTDTDWSLAMSCTAEGQVAESWAGCSRSADSGHTYLNSPSVGTR